MSVFKPFKAYRPSPEYAKEVASKPYDVLNSKEARIEAEGHEMSFLHVVKPEIDLPEDVDPYSHEVYLKGKANFKLHSILGLVSNRPAQQQGNKGKNMKKPRSAQNLKLQFPFRILSIRENEKLVD